MRLAYRPVIAEMAGERLVFPQCSEAEHDIVEPARAVGGVDLGDDAAVAKKPHAQPMLVGHRVDLDRLPVLRHAIGRMVQRGGGVHRSARDGGHCRGARKDSGQACAEFAAAADEHLARQVYHDIFVPFCRVIR
jgi:hypothetical protein